MLYASCTPFLFASSAISETPASLRGDNRQAIHRELDARSRSERGKSRDPSMASYKISGLLAAGCGVLAPADEDHELFSFAVWLQCVQHTLMETPFLKLGINAAASWSVRDEFRCVQFSAASKFQFGLNTYGMSTACT